MQVLYIILTKSNCNVPILDMDTEGTVMNVKTLMNAPAAWTTVPFKALAAT